MKIGEKILWIGTMTALLVILYSLSGLLGKRAAERAEPYVTALAGHHSKWTEDERRVMAKVLLECKDTVEDAEKGHLVVMAYCWRNNAIGVEGVKDPAAVIEKLLARGGKE